MRSKTIDKRLGKPMSVSTPDSRSEAAIKAWATRGSAPYRAAKSERASKTALSEWCQENGWKVVFFETATGSPRTGIVDAVIVRIKPRECSVVLHANADAPDFLQKHAGQVCSRWEKWDTPFST